MKHQIRPSIPAIAWTYAFAAVALICGLPVLLGDAPSETTTALAIALEVDAAQEDAAAQASRDWAATQVCGPFASATWVGDKDLVCTPRETVAARALP